MKKYDSAAAAIDQEKVNSLRNEIEKLQAQNKTLSELIISQRTVDEVAAKAIFRLSRELRNSGWGMDLRIIRGLFSFQSMAFAVCQEIYRMIHSEFGCDNHYITLYNRYVNPSVNDKGYQGYCKMIAYANQTRKHPPSYYQEFVIKKATRKKNEKIAHHTKLFLDNRDEISVIVKKEDIQEKFIFHESSMRREKSICQYIGIPVKVPDGDVTFLLQIDCDCDGLFGKTEEEMVTFSEKFINQYISLLSLYYEMDRMNEICYNYYNTHETKCS